MSHEWANAVSATEATPRLYIQRSINDPVTEVVMLDYVKSLLRDERGVSSLEYAVLAGIIVVALAAVGTYLSGTSGLQSIFTSLINKVSSLI